MRPHSPPRRRTAGFTLIELTIVLLVIAVVAGLAAPAISQALNQRRANEATLDLVRLIRNARSSAAAYGRAHLVRHVPNDMGQLAIYRGRNNRCNSNPWGALTGGGCEGNPNCIDQLDLNESRFRTSSFQVRLGLARLNAVEVCYEPTGIMWWRTTPAQNFIDLNNAQLGGGVRFTLTPQDNQGNQEGVIRRVVLPLGGDARVVR